MGTRSIIAIPEGKTGFRGRYCHWDGYPAGVGHALRSIVLRDGMETAIRTLIMDNYGWSSVNARAEQELDSTNDDGRFAPIPGYGIAYTTKDGQSSPDMWLTRKDESWCEWAYVLHSDHIDVYRATGVKWVKCAHYTIRFPELPAESLHSLDTEDLLVLT